VWNVIERSGGKKRKREKERLDERKQKVRFVVRAG